MEIYLVYNRTSSMYFEDKEDAEKVRDSSTTAGFQMCIINTIPSSKYSLPSVEEPAKASVDIK